jgi:hypothetical protein
MVAVGRRAYVKDPVTFHQVASHQFAALCKASLTAKEGVAYHTDWDMSRTTVLPTSP